MQSARTSVWNRLNSARDAAFTLIELITVMAIILVLAGLILGVAGYSQTKASSSRASAEIKALESAIESYKTDNGTYPRDATSTDLLNPQQNYDPASSGKPNYQSTSEFLYEALSGYLPTTYGVIPSTPTPPAGKSYFTFQPNQLGIATGATGATTATPTSPYMYIQDPFGFSYGYSTCYQNAVDKNLDTTGQGYNPTFDLWCTAGYSVTSGKQTPSSTTNSSQAAVYSNLWIKNW